MTVKHRLFAVIVVCATLFSLSVDVASRNATTDVTLTVESSCLFETSAMDFGSYSIGAADIKATSEVTVACTTGTPYSLTSGIDHTYELRNETGVAGNNIIPYTLYLDEASTRPLAGNRDLVNAGPSRAQTFSLYGKIEGQALLGTGAGSYTDTVILQLSY